MPFKYLFSPTPASSFCFCSLVRLVYPAFAWLWAAGVSLHPFHDNHPVFLLKLTPLSQLFQLEVQLSIANARPKQSATRSSLSVSSSSPFCSLDTGAFNFHLLVEDTSPILYMLQGTDRSVVERRHIPLGPYRANGTQIVLISSPSRTFFLTPRVTLETSFFFFTLPSTSPKDFLTSV
jgi:hypothetical protein